MLIKQFGRAKGMRDGYPDPQNKLVGSVIEAGAAMPGDWL
jgi:hypothetical protein